MESLDKINNMFGKFSICGEILPFFCHQGLWRKFMTKLSSASNDGWEIYKKAFFNLMKTMPHIKTLAYSKPFDEDFIKFINKNAQATAYKIEVNLKPFEYEEDLVPRANGVNYSKPKYHGTLPTFDVSLESCIKLFEEFLSDGVKNDTLVYFSAINLEPDFLQAEVCKGIYDLLLELGDNQHFALSNNGMTKTIPSNKKSDEISVYNSQTYVDYSENSVFEQSIGYYDDSKSIVMSFDPNNYPVQGFTNVNGDWSILFEDFIPLCISPVDKFYNHIKVICLDHGKQSQFLPIKDAKYFNLFPNLRQVRFRFGKYYQFRYLLKMISAIKSKNISYSLIKNKLSIMDEKSITFTNTYLGVSQFEKNYFFEAKKIKFEDYEVYDNYVMTENEMDLYGLKSIETLPADCTFTEEDVNSTGRYSGYFTQLLNVSEVRIHAGDNLEPWQFECPIKISIDGSNIFKLSFSNINEIPDTTPIHLNIRGFSDDHEFQEPLSIFSTKNIKSLYSTIGIYPKIDQNKYIIGYVKWLLSLPKLDKFIFRAETSLHQAKEYKFQNVTPKLMKNIVYMINKNKDIGKMNIVQDYITVK